MKPQQLMICKGWIAALYPERKESLLSLLSEQDAHVVSALPEPLPYDRELLKGDFLDRIHPTWIAPFVRTLASNEIPFFLAALSSSQSESLSELLGYAGPTLQLTRMGKQALRKILRHRLLQSQELLPFAFLPQSPYNSLFNLTNQKLARLVRFLGLHDLAFEMRQIIATKELKKIFSALMQKEGEFLKLLLLHQEPLIFERLFLKKWDGTKEHLHKLLDERGLCRLGHAVHDESESFLWYLAHQLNIHHAALLFKYKKKPTHPRGEEILEKQVAHALKEII